MNPTIVFCCLLSFFVYEDAAGQSKTCETSEGSSLMTSALYKSLVSGMDSSVRPMSDCGGPVQTGGFITLLNFYRDRVNPGIYRLNGILTYIWNDSRLAWDPSQHANIQKMRIPSNKIWTPDFVASNVFEYNKGDRGSVIYNAVVLPTGLVTLYVPSTATGTGVSALDASGHDVVTYSTQDASLTYDSADIIIGSADGAITTSAFYDADNTSEYTFVSGRVKTFDQIFATSTTPYSVVQVDFTFRSKATFDCLPR